MAYLLDVLFRYAHIVFGVAWIGLLYYFNFVFGCKIKIPLVVSRAPKNRTRAIFH